MTYTLILPATTLTEGKELLNGITTRRQKLILETASLVGAAPQSLVGDVQVFAFDTADVLYANWPIPQRIDRSVDMTLTLLGAPAGTETTKQISFDAKILSVDSTAGTLISGTTGTAQLVDQSVNGTAATVEEFTITLAAATYLGSAVNALAIELTRVAATTDLAGDWHLVDASITYTIER